MIEVGKKCKFTVFARNYVLGLIQFRRPLGGGRKNEEGAKTRGHKN